MAIDETCKGGSSRSGCSTTLVGLCISLLYVFRHSDASKSRCWIWCPRLTPVTQTLGREGLSLKSSCSPALLLGLQKQVWDEVLESNSCHLAEQILVPSILYLSQSLEVCKDSTHSSRSQVMRARLSSECFWEREYAIWYFSTFEKLRLEVSNQGDGCSHSSLGSYSWSPTLLL